MRPQDIAVLLKIIMSHKGWKSKDISNSLLISPSEISYSLQRSVLSGLLDVSKQKVMRNALTDFIRFGLPYVFPAIKGPVARGIPTAYAAPVMAGRIVVTEFLVWPHPEGTVRGETIAPLYPNAADAALKDEKLYALLALIDVMRLGKVREREAAMKLLKQIIGKHA